MRLVVDTNVIVSECLRERGRALLTHPKSTLYQPEYAVGETLYEVERRIAVITKRGIWAADEARTVSETITTLLQSAIQIIPAADYAAFEAVARRRVPQDPNDWTLVASALAMGADILTLDTDFLGCGVATWTPPTLQGEVGTGR